MNWICSANNNVASWGALSSTATHADETKHKCINALVIEDTDKSSLIKSNQSRVVFWGEEEN